MTPDQINAMFDATENARLAEDEKQLRAEQAAEAEAIAAVPDEAADIARKLLDRVVSGHLNDAEEQGEDHIGPHPISIEGDARAIVAAVTPIIKADAYSEAAGDLDALASYHEGAFSDDWMDGVRTAQKLIAERADALRADAGGSR